MLRRTLLVLLAAGALPATGAGLRGIGTGEPLQPGESRAVRVAGGLVGVEPGDEYELVLSLDGGRTFALRVSPEVDSAAEADGLVFTVPNLPTRCAVLGLRAGHEGEGERVVAVSEPFLVVGRSAAPLEPLFTVRGELATREASAKGSEGEPASGLGPAGTALVAAEGALDLEEPGDGAPDVPPAPASLLPATGRSAADLRPSAPPEALPAPFRPKRE